MKNLYVLLFSILNLIKLSQCKYNLTVLLLSFDNGQGFLANGGRCDPMWYANKQCNIRIQVCVDFGSPVCNPEEWPSLSHCSQMNQTSCWYDLGVVTSDSNNITFQQQLYDSWSNPMTFSKDDSNFQGFTVSFVATNINAKTQEEDLIDSWQNPFSDGNSILDFDYYSHDRPLGDGNWSINCEPTLTGLAWRADGDVLHPIPTVPPTTTTTTPGPTTSYVALPKDCSDPLVTNSGVQTLRVLGKYIFNVTCDFVSAGTGGITFNRAYTVIQSRGPKNTQQTFNQTWNDYVNPFGTVEKDSNYWVGLENMWALTQQFSYGLRIDLCCGDTPILPDGSEYPKNNSWLYFYFKLGDASTKYQLIANSTKYGLGVDNSPFKTDINAVFSTYENYTSTATGPPFFQSPNYCPVLNYPQSSNPSGPHQGNIGGWWFGSCANNLNGYYYPYGDLVFKDNSTCELDLGKFDPNGYRTGTGIEMAVGTQKSFAHFSYTKARMALFRLDSVQGVNTAPPPIDPWEFCKS